jgi:hypothetical protein
MPYRLVSAPPRQTAKLEEGGLALMQVALMQEGVKFQLITLKIMSSILASKMSNSPMRSKISNRCRTFCSPNESRHHALQKINHLQWGLALPSVLAFVPDDCIAFCIA